MLFELKGHVCRQEHEFRLNDLHLALCFHVLDKATELLHRFDSIYARHLEVKQTQLDWLDFF